MVHRLVSHSASGRKKEFRQWLRFKKLLPAERMQMAPGWWRCGCKWCRGDGIASGAQEDEDATIADDDDNLVAEGDDDEMDAAAALAVRLL